MKSLKDLNLIDKNNINQTKKRPQSVTQKDYGIYKNTLYNNSFIKKINNNSLVMYCDPDVVEIMNIEKNNLYEVPVRVYNCSNKIIRVSIKQPQNNYFKVDYIRTNANNQIAPGLYLEILVIFEPPETEDYFDSVEIASDKNFKIDLDLKAFKKKAIVVFEPFVNFGFVPVNSKRTATVMFSNNGLKDTNIELKFDNPDASDVLSLNTYNFNLPSAYKNKKNISVNNLNSEDSKIINNNLVSSNFKISNYEVIINYDNKGNSKNLSESIKVYQTDNIYIGKIDVIATTINQNLAIVFEDGGGINTSLNFGTIYYGQSKFTNAFLINNGSCEVYYKMIFHNNKKPKDFKDNYSLDDSGYLNNPKELGKEIASRILNVYPKEGFVKPYDKIPIKISCRSNAIHKQYGWKNDIFEDTSKLLSNKLNNNYTSENDEYKYHYSTVAVKFKEANTLKITSNNNNNNNSNSKRNKLSNSNKQSLSNINNLKNKDNIAQNFCINDNKIAETLSMLLEVKTILPSITIDKLSINFWECSLNERKYSTLKITNKNPSLPVDFKFKKVANFIVEPNEGIIYSGNEFVVVDIAFYPHNFGRYEDSLILKYVNELYEIKIDLLGVCKIDNNNNSVFNVKENEALFNKKNYKTTNNFMSINFHNKRLFSANTNNNRNIGVFSTDKDFYKNKYYVNDSNVLNNFLPKLSNFINNNNIYCNDKSYFKDKKMYELRIEQMKMNNCNSEIINNFKKQYDEFKKIEYNKQRANNYLEYSRKKRKNKELYENAKKNYNCSNNNNQSNKHIVNSLHSKITESNTSLNNLNKCNTALKDNNLALNQINNDITGYKPIKFKTSNITKEPLYVCKPIGIYEPIEDNNESNLNSTNINSSINSTYLKHLNTNLRADEINIIQQPSELQDIKDCQLNLTGKDLQKIDVIPDYINFGDVFVKSYKVKTFWIRNNLRSSIFIEFDSVNLQDLINTKVKSLVIKPNCSEGFNLVYYSEEAKLKNLFYVKYTINYKYNFKLKIIANVVSAKLNYSQLPTFTFNTTKESDMSITKDLCISNDGNASVSFVIEDLKTKYFSIDRNIGEVPAKSSINLKVSFDPKEYKEKKDIDDELKIKITNGGIDIIKIKGIVIPSEVKIISGDECDFGNIHVGLEAKSQIRLQNEKFGNTAFKIGETKGFLRFEPSFGVIDNKVNIINVTFKSLNQQNYNEKVYIYIRGGSTLVINVKANVIIPILYVTPKVCNFGQVAFGERKTLKLNFKNESIIDAYVIINLNEETFKNFSINLPDNCKDKYDLITDLASEEVNRKNTNLSPKKFNRNLSPNKYNDKAKLKGLSNNNNNNNNNNNACTFEDESFIKKQFFDKNSLNKDLRYFKLKITKQSTLTTDFTYKSAFDFKHQTIKKLLVFEQFGVSKNKTSSLGYRLSNTATNYIADSNTNNNNSSNTNRSIQDKIYLETQVIAESCTCKISVIPETLIFEKTYLVKSSSNSRTYSLKIRNSSEDNKTIQWRIDESELDQCFTIRTKRGEIIANSSIDISITFLPEKTQKYYSNFKIQILNSSNEYEDAKDVVVQGEGAYPRAYFDVKEVLMPVVPLGFDSFYRLKIYNDGYEESKLNCRIDSEMGALPIELKWVDNVNLISETKENVYLDIKFCNKKPLSFTCKLVISDSDNEDFPILLSGTTDNSIFTNINFYLTLQDYLYFKKDNNIFGASIHYKDNLNFIYNFKNKSTSNSNATINSMFLDYSNLNIKNNIDESLIISKLHNKYFNDIKDVSDNYASLNSFIINLLNFTLNTSIYEFPNDLSSLENKGLLLTELVFTLSRKNPIPLSMYSNSNNNVNSTNIVNKNSKNKDNKNNVSNSKKIKFNDDELNNILQLKRVFSEIVKFLQQHGCLLNTVFPEYLLDSNCYIKFLKQDSNTNKLLKDNWSTDRKEGIHINHKRYLYEESWTILILQIYKIFYFNKINISSFDKIISIFPKEFTSKYNIVYNEDNLNKVQEINLNETEESIVCYNYILKKNNQRQNNSNFFSTNELILLLWIKFNYDFYNIDTKKQKDFFISEMNINTIDNKLENNKKSISNMPIFSNYLNNGIKSISEDIKNSNIITFVFSNYFLNNNKLNNLKKLKNIDGKVSNNIEKAINNFGEYGVFTPLTLENLLLGKEIEILMYYSFIYQNLIFFIPKDTIIFQCILGDCVKKSIILKHTPAITHNNKVEYSIKKEGDDFTLENTEDVILKDAGEEKEIFINFKSRFFESSKGKIYFLNRAQGLQHQNYPLVYDLKSIITERKSIGNITLIRSCLYEKTDTKISVTNPYKIKGEFTITKLEIIKKEHIYTEKDKEINKKYNARNKSKNNKKEIKEATPNIFFLRNRDHTVNLSAIEPKDITISFCPIDMHVYTCNIILINETIGEFQVTVEGQAENPNYLGKIEETITVEDKKDIYIHCCFKNKLFENAWELLAKNDNETSKEARERITKNLSYDDTSITFNVISTNNNFIVSTPYVLNNNLKNLVHNKSINKLNNNKNIENKSYNSYNSNTNVGNSIKFMNSNSESLNNITNSNNNNNNFQNDELNNPLLVKFTSKVCKYFEGDIILTNTNNNIVDIRVYKLIINVKPKNINAKLMFNCPINQQIIQEIPFQNQSDTDWLLKCDLIYISDPNYPFFSCLPDKKIHKNSIENYSIKFNPTQKVNNSAKLSIKNQFTKETYEYDLIGKVDDPLAESLIEIDCNVMEEKTVHLNITNPYNDEVVYSVETDLQDIFIGSNKFIIKNSTSGVKNTYKYDFKIKPLLGKVYFGKICFYDNKGNYIWYTIKVNSKSKIEPNLIELKTSVRSSIYIEIKLENIKNYKISVNINYDGLYLSGDNKLEIESNSFINYKLYFNPLSIGIWEGFVNIFSDSIGELLYKVKLISEPSSIVYLDTIKSELGKSNYKDILLENPTNIRTNIKYTISYANDIKTNYDYSYNPCDLFKIKPKDITLVPNSLTEVKLYYTPNSIDIQDEISINFVSEDIGNWNYIARGIGTRPSIMKTVRVNTYIDGVVSDSIRFQNPYSESITVYINLNNINDETSIDSHNQQAFTLLSKKHCNINPNGYININFTFSPKKLVIYKAELIISQNKNINWKYIIEGITEVRNSSVKYYLKTKSKKPCVLSELIKLTNCLDIIDINDLSIIVKPKDNKYISDVNKSLQYNLQTNKEKDYNNSLSISKNQQNSNSVCANYDRYNQFLLNFNYLPFKPYKIDCDLIISRKQGGQWIFSLILESKDPDVESVIKIKSSINKRATYIFYLNNLFSKCSEFKAYFTEDSSTEFSVKPSEGVLEAYGKQ